MTDERTNDDDILLLVRATIYGPANDTVHDVLNHNLAAEGGSVGHSPLNVAV